VPGNSVVPDGDGYIELDEDGVPLGRWEWCPDEEFWIFDDATPLADMPATGDGLPYTLLFMLIGFLLIASGLLIEAARGIQIKFIRRKGFMRIVLITGERDFARWYAKS
jgi:hypothetical protein